MSTGKVEIDDNRLREIRNLSDFDFRMFLMEVHDFGIFEAQATLVFMLPNPSQDEYLARKSIAAAQRLEQAP